MKESLKEREEEKENVVVTKKVNEIYNEYGKGSGNGDGITIEMFNEMKEKIL